MRRPAALLSVFLCLSVTAGGRAEPAGVLENSWQTRLLSRAELPAGQNALTRWRLLYPKLIPENADVFAALERLSSPLESLSSADSPELKPWLDSVAPLPGEFTVRDGESFQLPASTGPETPFPDHQPLRQLAVIRVALMKTAWLEGRPDESLADAIENLRLSRAFLSAQEGLVPVIQANGVWKLSLDGVYWLACQPALSPEAAARLQSELLADEFLAAKSLIRAFRGEFTFFTHLVMERLPKTNDVNLLLSGIGSLGMAPPEAPAEGELRLATPERDPFDRNATLQAAADDIGGWIAAFGENRHPHGLALRHTQARLRAFSVELGDLLVYASEDAPPTVERIAAADKIAATVDNSVGKLFLVITTSHWEPLSTHAFRREAERRALIGLLAWKRHGKPAAWKDLVAAGLPPAAPADPFGESPLKFDLNPLRPRVWSVGENGLDDGGEGSGENLGRPLDLTWPWPVPPTSARPADGT